MNGFTVAAVGRFHLRGRTTTAVFREGGAVSDGSDVQTAAVDVRNTSVSESVVKWRNQPWAGGYA